MYRKIVLGVVILLLVGLGGGYAGWYYYKQSTSKNQSQSSHIVDNMPKDELQQNSEKNKNDTSLTKITPVIKNTDALVTYTCWDFKLQYNPTKLQIGYSGVSEDIIKAGSVVVKEALAYIQDEKSHYCTTTTNPDGSKTGYSNILPAGTHLPCYQCDGSLEYIIVSLDDANTYKKDFITNATSLQRASLSSVQLFDYDDSTSTEFPIHKKGKVFQFSTKSGMYSLRLSYDNLKSFNISQIEAEKQFQDVVDTVK